MLDGEAVVLGENGVSSFHALQEALSDGRHDRIVFYAFDVFHLFFGACRSRICNADR